MAVNLLTLERQTAGLLGVIASDSATNAEANYVSASALTVTQLNDPAFPPAFIRDLIADALLQVQRLICLTEGHARRVDYRATVSKNHGDALPSAVAFGRVYSGSNEFTPVDSPNQITDVLADTGSANSVSIYEYCFSGGTVLLSQASATLEYFTVSRIAATPALLAALFDGGDTVALGDEFISPVVNLAAGLGCLRTGSYLDQGQSHLQYAYQLLMDTGIKIQATDFFKSLTT